MICFANVSDIVSSKTGIWQRAQTENNDELARLARELPRVMAGSKAPATVKAYTGGFSRWKTWATRQGIQPLPAEPYYVGLYLISVSQSVTSPSAIDLALFSLSWAHNISGLCDPAKDTCVKEISASLKRALSGNKKKKEVFTIELLNKLESITQPKNCLQKMRLYMMCLLSFAGFLRFDEVSHLKYNEITFESTHMVLFIAKRLD